MALFDNPVQALSFGSMPSGGGVGALAPQSFSNGFQPMNWPSSMNVSPQVPAGMAGPLQSLGGGAGGIGGMGFLPTAQLALSGIGTIGNLWAAFQAQKLAKQQFRYTKDVTETNLKNSIQSYNTQLEDRSRNRGIVEGKDYTDWYDKNKMTRGS